MIPRGLAVAGVASLVEPATTGSGGATEPTISSSLGNVADQTGAYAPTLTISDGATVLTTAWNSSTGAVTVTGSTTTTPSVPEPAAGSGTVVTHTATAGGLTKTIAFVVGKASASGAVWSPIFDIDLTTVDNAGPWTTGDVTLTTDSTATNLINFTTTRNNASSPGTAEAVNGSGVEIIAGGNFSITGAFDVAAKIAAVSGAWGASQYRGKTILVQVCIEYANVNSGDGIIVAFDTAKTALVESRGYRSDSVAGSNETYEVRNDTTDDGVEAAVARATSGVISLYLVDAEVVWVDRTLGTLTPPAYSMTNAYRAGITVQNNNTAPRFATDCNLCLLAVDDSTITVKRILAGVME